MAETIVPELADAGDADWQRLTEIVGRALSQQDPAVQRKLVWLIRILNWMPLATKGRCFVALDADARRVFLERLQSSRWLALRRGIWGLRSLVFLGYYTRPAVRARLGYRAQADGWEAIRDGQAPS